MLLNNTKLYLLMLRCGYIELKNYRLTDKGRGFLPQWGWRAWNSLLCYWSGTHRTNVVTFLRGQDLPR